LINFKGIPLLHDVVTILLYVTFKSLGTFVVCFKENWFMNAIFFVSLSTMLSHPSCKSTCQFVYHEIMGVICKERKNRGQFLSPPAWEPVIQKVYMLYKISASPQVFLSICISWNYGCYLSDREQYMPIFWARLAENPWSTKWPSMEYDIHTRSIKYHVHILVWSRHSWCCTWIMKYALRVRPSAFISLANFMSAGSQLHIIKLSQFYCMLNFWCPGTYSLINFNFFCV
jgi:hypothetical protein